MAESDSPLRSTLWAIPAPLILIATVAALAFFGLQRTSNEAGMGKAVSPQAAAAPARASDPAAPSRSPALELLRRYLNEVRDEDSSKGEALEPSSHLAVPDSLVAAATARLSSTVESPASLALPGETKEERRFRDLKEELRRLRQDHPFEMQCLVATIPDPIDSHLQLMFDAGLAAMTRGCEEHDYMLDRHELPWSRELRDRPVTGRPDVRKYRFPGAVLFRKMRKTGDFKGGETCDLLMLLLVGETPTGGIRKNSLCAALDFAGAWDWASRGSRGSRSLSIRLIGPTFSGSSSSLRWTVFDWKENRHLSRYAGLELDIVSGSATAKCNRDLLTVRTESTGRDENGWPPLTMEFHSTVIPDGVTEVRLMEHLVSMRGIPRDRIALLIEGNTGYGQALADFPVAVRQSGVAAPKEAGFESGLVLPFPMALSRIRSEYEQSQAERGDVAGEVPRVTRRNLKLPLDPPPYATDVLPTFADGTAAVTDLSLEQILATISRRGIRAVGIVGTDIRDKLFLAQQVRRYAPNVQLFMFESDLLYTHADYAPSLSGTLIASTYPLFTQNQPWTGRREKELLFPADTAEGIYNATVHLLNRMTPSESRRLVDYSYPFEPPPQGSPRRSIPPLWLTIAGENGIWPVQACRLAPEECDGVLALDTSSTIPDEAEWTPDPPSCLPALVASLVSGAFLLVFWAVNCRPASGGERADEGATACSPGLGRIRASCRWLALPTAGTAQVGNHDAGTRKSPRSHLLSASCFFLALFAQQLLLSSPTVAYLFAAFAHRSIGAMWWELLLSLVALTLSTALLWVVLPLAFRLLGHVAGVALPAAGNAVGRPFTRATWLKTAAGLLVFVGCVWWGSSALDPEGRTQLAIFIERVGTLSNGVTWLVPAALLAAIVGCWSACQLWRRHFLEIYPLANPVSPREDGGDGDLLGPRKGVHTAGFDERFRDLNSRLQATWFMPTEIVDWLFLVVLGFGVIYVLGLQWVGTAEGRTFDLLFRSFAAVAILLIGWSLIHVKSVGGLFERLLRRTAQHAMVSAFDRVPDRLAAKAAGQIFAASPHPGDLEQPVRCLAQLAEEAPELWWNAPQKARASQEQLAKLLDCPRDQKADVERRAADLNVLLADIAARRIVPRLVPYWNRKAAVRETREDSPESARSLASWELRAEVFLAMQFVNVVRQVFAHIKNELTFLVVMLLCLLAAFHAYPFQPSRLIMQLCYGLTCWCLITTVLLIFGFNRCEVLSRLSRTVPNRFTFDRTLVLPLLTFVAIPLLSLLAVQFPGIGRMLFGWLETCRDSLAS